MGVRRALLLVVDWAPCSCLEEGCSAAAAAAGGRSGGGGGCGGLGCCCCWCCRSLGLRRRQEEEMAAGDSAVRTRRSGTVPLPGWGGGGAANAPGQPCSQGLWQPLCRVACHVVLWCCGKRWRQRSSSVWW
jgi:hypothetical protein